MAAKKKAVKKKASTVGVDAPSSKKWEARWDAQTLADAEKIKADKKRHAAATKAATKLAAEKEAEAKAMKCVAKKD